MNTIIIAFALFSLTLCGSSEADDFDRNVRVANAQLAAPNGESNITARLTLVDTGRSLSVFGFGNGFDPNKHYHTLIYDTGATPSGPTACRPSANPPVPLSTDQMQIGAWQKIGGTSRSLFGVRSGLAYVPLANIGVISVRRHDQTGATVQLVLQSCGAVILR